MGEVATEAHPHCAAVGRIRSVPSATPACTGNPPSFCRFTHLACGRYALHMKMTTVRRAPITAIIVGKAAGLAYRCASRRTMSGGAPAGDRARPDHPPLAPLRHPPGGQCRRRAQRPAGARVPGGGADTVQRASFESNAGRSAALIRPSSLASARTQRPRNPLSNSRNYSPP